jgi:hypothetical protein
MEITSAQYVLGEDGVTNEAVKAIVDGKSVFVPLDPSNRHYAEIMRQVELGELVIQEAD